MLYYGARYYDPRTSVWQSADPALDVYIDGSGNNGVFNSSNLALYAYAYQNPVIYIDPSGNKPKKNDDGFKDTGTYELTMEASIPYKPPKKKSSLNTMAGGLLFGSSLGPAAGLIAIPVWGWIALGVIVYFKRL